MVSAEHLNLAGPVLSRLSCPVLSDSRQGREDVGWPVLTRVVTSGRRNDLQGIPEWRLLILHS